MAGRGAWSGEWGVGSGTTTKHANYTKAGESHASAHSRDSKNTKTANRRG